MLEEDGVLVPGWALHGLLFTFALKAGGHSQQEVVTVCVFAITSHHLL